MRKASFLLLSIFTGIVLLKYSNALWNDNLTIKSSINTGQWLVETDLLEVSQEGLSNISLSMEPAVLDTVDSSAALEEPAAKLADEEKVTLDIIETRGTDSQKDVDSAANSNVGTEEPADKRFEEEDPTSDIIEIADGENIDNNFVEDREIAKESNLEDDTVDYTTDEIGDEIEKDASDDQDSNEKLILNEDPEKNNENSEEVK